jgi:hypothetical protein
VMSLLLQSRLHYHSVSLLFVSSFVHVNVGINDIFWFVGIA